MNPFRNPAAVSNAITLILTVTDQLIEVRKLRAQRDNAPEERHANTAQS